jgi:hypothetical protein
VSSGLRFVTNKLSYRDAATFGSTRNHAGSGCRPIAHAINAAGKIRASDVRERIATAKARIDIDHVTAVIRNKHVALQNPDMAQLFADHLANHLESIIPHRYRSISLPSPHPDFAHDKSADIAAVEIVDSEQSLLDENRVLRITGADFRKETALDLLLGKLVGKFEFLLVFRELHPNRASAPAGFNHQRKGNITSRERHACAIERVESMRYLKTTIR